MTGSREVSEPFVGPGGLPVVIMAFNCVTQNYQEKLNCEASVGRVVGLQSRVGGSWWDCPWEVVCEMPTQGPKGLGPGGREGEDGPGEIPDGGDEPGETGDEPGEGGDEPGEGGDKPGDGGDPPEEDPGAISDWWCERTAAVEGPPGSSKYENALADCLEKVANADPTTVPSGSDDGGDTAGGSKGGL